MQTLKKKQLFSGKFEVQGEISKGQTGTIYYGYDMGLRQEVAIKIYHSHINGRLIQGKAFIEKSKPLLLIDHPNLIKIFKVEEDDDTPVVFMEFFDAPSLQQIIHDKGSLSVQDMLMLAREIAEVLVHTHFQGIIHGTLHPGHVLVGPQGQIKVMDLGLSWILIDILSNCDEEVLRPLPYFPPEIAKGELLNVSSDLYSLGFMMYEMLTGTVPYSGLPKTSIMGKLAFDQTDPKLQFHESVPEAICDLIRQMTRNKTQERLQDATHVLTIINQQLSKLPVDKKSIFLPFASPQIQTPPAAKQSETQENEAANPAPSQPTTMPEEPLPNESSIQRPQKLMDSKQANHQGISRKIVMTISLVALLGIAGSLGYWFRDLLEPHMSAFQNHPEVQGQPNNPNPVMPTESDSAIQQNSHTQGIPDSPINNVSAPESDPPPTIAPSPKAEGPTTLPHSHDPAVIPKPSTNQPASIVSSPKSTDPLPKTIPLSQGSGKGPKTATEPKTQQTQKATQEAPIAPTLNAPAQSQEPHPTEQQPSVTKPTASAISPGPVPRTSQEGAPPESSPHDQPLIPISQTNVSAASTPPTETMTQDSSDKEIEELLKTLDVHPGPNPPSATAP